MDSTEKSVAIIKRAIRKHWKMGGRIRSGRWGLRVSNGVYIAAANCCPIAAYLDGKKAPKKEVDMTTAQYANELLGLDNDWIGDFIDGFDDKWSFSNSGDTAGRILRKWVKENQK